MMAWRTGMDHGRFEGPEAAPGDSSGERMLRLPEPGPGLRDLWGIYDAHYDEISAATLKSILRAPEGRVLAQSVGAYRTSVASPEASRSRLRAAMVDGEWGPYIESIRGLGCFYAREGLAFRVWPMTVHALWTELRDLVATTHEHDVRRLLTCLGAAQDYVNVLFVVIAEEYIREWEATIGRQQAIRELSTPVLLLKPGLLVVPIIGVVDQPRTEQLREQLLTAIREHRARVVVLDVTGVAGIEAAVAPHLMRAVAAARLMGARAVLSGLSTTNAQVLADTGIDLAGVVTASDLRAGIQQADAMLPTALRPRRSSA
jgi:rsbT co-antagonist protein RsbR